MTLPSTKAEALASGSKTFFTGRPCKHGHIAQRHVASGSCLECIRIQTSTPHHRALCRQWRKDNPGRVKTLNERWKDYRRVANQKWRVANPDLARQKTREWYARNSEKARAKRRVYYSEHREQSILTYKKWAAKNPDRVREWHKQWKKNNPDKIRSYDRIKDQRRRSAPGRHTVSDVKDIFRLQKGRCGYCRCRLQENYHVDHIVALSKGGSHDRRNLQLLCQPCNQSKHCKDPIEFAQSLGRLL